MKFVYPDIDYVFETDKGFVNTIVIEEPKLFYSLITDIQKQVSGLDGLSVLSDNNSILSFEKRAELLTGFIPFELNSKALLSKITSEIEKEAVSDRHYEECVELIGAVDSFLSKITFDFNCDLEFSKIGIDSIIKSAGVRVCDNYDSLAEKLLDYFEVVTEFLGKKLFITVNLRSYISDNEMELFIKDLLSHEFHVIMIENCEHTKFSLENRVIIDSDLCVIV